MIGSIMIAILLVHDTMWLNRLLSLIDVTIRFACFRPAFMLQLNDL